MRVFVVSVGLTGLATGLLLQAGGQAQAQTFADTPAPPQTVVVIGQSPLDAGVEADRVPGAAAALNTDDLKRSGRADLLGAIDARIGGVAMVQAQGNPFQPNLMYRGFEASPLAGDPQGIAVYLDGSRFNQSFGDTVDWDLVPDIAVESVDLVASNPAFGLNALGGAINMRLKTAQDMDGTEAELSGGSFGRRQASAESGQRFGDVGLYVAAAGLDEDGWRDFSPSRLRQGYADLGWQGAGAELHVNLLLADNTLTGNGVSPVQLLDADRSAVFTHPDTTENSYQRLGVSGDWTLSDAWSLRARGYGGWLTRATRNGDAAEVEPCDDDADLLCADDSDIRLLDSGGDAIANFITGSPYADEFPDYEEGGPYAYLNHSRTRTTNWGASVLATRTAPLFGLSQRLSVGGSVDQARTRFAAGTTIGGLSLDRGWFGPGVEVDQPEADISPVSVHVTTAYWGVFASDAIDLSPRLTLTLTGRANVASLKLRDQLGDALNGDHRFERFNPAAGLSWRFMDGASVYGGYSEANRAPTPAELSCADPDAPCSLSNFFVADPPLKQVVARTIEIGARGGHALGADAAVDWHFGAYRTDADDDIQMVAGETVGRGYFTNVGTTRRQGIEAGGSLRTARLTAFVDYAWTDATYRTAFDLMAGANPAFDDEADTMPVAVGDHRPGIPAHSLKAGIDYEVADGLTLGGDAVWASGRYFAGDEANLNPRTDSYAVLNLHAVQAVGKRLSLFVQIANVLDATYETFGAFSPVDDVPVAGGLVLDDARALSPGAPRAAYVGLRLRL